MKNNPAYRRLKAYCDALDLTAAQVDPKAMAVDPRVEKAMFRDGRPRNDGTRALSALRCYKGVLEQREREAEEATLLAQVKTAIPDAKAVEITSDGYAVRTAERPIVEEP